jgi:hypothetical protein
MASTVLEVPRMKKMLSKKLQLRSATIALLTGRGLGIAKGGTNDNPVDGGGGGLGGGNSGVPMCEPAGNYSRNDGGTKPLDCNLPITDGH